MSITKALEGVTFNQLFAVAIILQLLMDLVILSFMLRWEKIHALENRIANLDGQKKVLGSWIDTEKQRAADNEKVRQQISAYDRRTENWTAHTTAEQERLGRLWKKAPAPIVTPAPAEAAKAEAEAEQAVMRHLRRERPLMLTAGSTRIKAKRLGFTKSQRFAIFKRDHYRCQICGSYASDDLTLEVDHKIPVAKGGTNEPENLWTLCFDCNRGKSDSDLY